MGGETVNRNIHFKVTVLLSSAYLVWRWGLQGFGTHLSVALAIALLIFNAYLGAKAWADLHQQNQDYLKQQTVSFPLQAHIVLLEDPFQRPAPHIRPTEIWRNAASPVWIERNTYYENSRSNHTDSHRPSDISNN